MNLEKQEQEILVPDVKVEIRSDTSETPSPRVTDPWSKKIDGFMQTLRAEAVKKRDDHALAGHHFRKLEIRWRLPSVLTPAVLAPIILLVGMATSDSCDTITPTDYISTVGFALTAFFTSINNFFRYGNLSAKHHLFSAKYSDIVTDIDAEVIKQRKFRMSADVFLTIMKMKYDNLVFGEPVVPRFIENTTK